LLDALFAALDVDLLPEGFGVDLDVARVG